MKNYKEQERVEAMNEALRYIYNKYNNTTLTDEVLADFNKNTVTEEANKEVFCSPIYKTEGGPCTKTVNIQYKDKNYTVLRSSLSTYHAAKIPVGRWGRIRVKLSTLKIK
jgi:hypothetical protein